MSASIPVRTPETNLEVDVPLHVLCGVCKSFCQTWDVLVEAPGSHGEAVARTWTPVFLCKAAYLAQSHRHCHLCNLVWTASRRFPVGDRIEKSPDADVHLQAVAGENGMIVVHVKLEHEVQEREERRKVVASFVLGSHKCMFNAMS